MIHDCAQELRNVELKVTPIRVGILQVLESTDTPLDAQAIQAGLSKRKISADRVTVFRTLHTLTKGNLVKSIQLNEDKFRYEVTAKPEHHHFVCESCGAIEDVKGCTLESLERMLEKKNGFKITHHSLEFFGLCADCT